MLTPHADIALHELNYYLKEERLGERGNVISYGIKRFDIPEFIHGNPRQVGGPAESDEERNRAALLFFTRLDTFLFHGKATLISFKG